MKIKGLRSYFREKWLPKALLIGMTEKQFWETNPRKMKAYSEAYKLKRMEIDENNWMLGMYIRSAITSALDKRGRYPDKPHLQEIEENRVIDGSQMSEEEQEAARRKIMMSMGLPTALLDG